MFRRDQCWLSPTVRAIEIQFVFTVTAYRLCCFSTRVTPIRINQAAGEKKKANKNVEVAKYAFIHIQIVATLIFLFIWMMDDFLDD